MQPAPTFRSHKIWMAAAWLVFGLSCLHTARLAWVWDMPSAPRRDFVQLFAGGRAALAHQSPYDTRILEQQYVAAGGVKEHLPPWKWELPLYPPSALLFGVPFAGMQYDAAARSWFWINLVALLGGVGLLSLLTDRRWRPLAVVLAACAVASPATVLVIGMGQPAALTFALLFVGILAAFRKWPAALGKWPAAVGVIAFALALLLKVQLALAILIYLLLAERYRKIAAAALGVWAVVLVATVLWLQMSPATAGWLHEMRQNVAASMRSGGSANPEPSNPTALTFTNLQAVTAMFFSTPRGYNFAAYAIVLPLGLWWLAGIWRANWSPARDVLAVAAAAALALLPVYSFYYNLPLLALTIPGVMWLLAHRRGWGVAALLCLVPAIFWNLQLHVQHWLIVHRPGETPGRLETVLLLREYPLAVAVSAVVLVAALWVCAPSGGPQDDGAGDPILAEMPAIQGFPPLSN